MLGWNVGSTGIAKLAIFLNLAEGFRWSDVGTNKRKEAKASCTLSLQDHEEHYDDDGDGDGDGDDGGI